MTRRVALVTGAARGIGRAIAEDLASDHDVAITWHTTDPGPLLAERPEVLPIQADLADEAAAQRIVQAVLDQFAHLDVLVMNAGMVVPSPIGAPDLSAQRAMVDVNLLAPMALLAAALPHLGAGAAVVNISSVNAVLPPRGAAGYGATKAALDLWTRGMAKELGPRGIRVNAVAPGAVETPDRPRSADLLDLFVAETALGHLATPPDIARAVRFLSSHDAAAITGEVLTVSGGYRL